MTWKHTNGLAIAKYPFLPSGEGQIPLLTGDKFEILDETEKWFHGRNILTGLDGIFPKNFVTFFPGENLSTDILLGKEEDLLWREASAILREAFMHIQSAEVMESDVKAKFFNAIFKVIGNLKFFKNPESKVEEYPEHHMEVANGLDELYTLLGRTPPDRTSTNAINTLTTWGREMFVQGMETSTVNTLPEYVILKVHVDIRNLRKVTSLRFALYQGKASPFTSAPISFLVQPTRPSVDLLFDQLDLSTCKDPTYLVIYAYDFMSSDQSDRICTSCALIELPTCRSRTIFKKSNEEPIKRSGSSKTAIEESIQNLHYEMLTQSIKTPGMLSYDVNWAAYQGTYHSLLEQYPSFKNFTRVPPFCLPQTVVPTEHRSIVFLTIREILHNSKTKRSRVVIKLLDSVKNEFVPCIENIETHKYDQNEWATTSFKGGKIRSSETFAIDLSKTDTPIDKLYIAVDLQRSNESEKYSSGYAVLKLSDDTGCLPSNWQSATKNFYHWPKRGNNEREPKDFPLKEPENRKARDNIGHISYALSFASTSYTTIAYLYHLVHYKPENQQNMESVKKAIEHWNEIPISEWSKFVKELLLSFSLIISEGKTLVNEAFGCLKDVFVKILVTPTYGGHIRLLDEFVKNDFPEELRNKKCLSFYQNVISNIISDLDSIKMDTQEYRSLIKIFPYILQLAAQSYNASVIEVGIKSDSKVVEGWNSSINAIFKKLIEIVSIVPDDNDTDIQKKSSIFAVQQLIIKYIPQTIEAVRICYDKKKITSIIKEFIEKIRFKAGDPKQALIEKSKIRLILALSSTDSWKDEESCKELQSIFKKILAAGIKVEKTVDLVNATLASLFFAKRNNFIIDFLDDLQSTYYNEENERLITLSRLLLTVAFTFPEKFVDSRNQLIIDLMNSKIIGPRERLFTYAHYLRENAEALSKKMKDPEFKLKDKIIMTYFDVAIEAKTENTSNMIDEDVYPSQADFSVIKKLLSCVSHEEIKENFSEISNPLIKCYALYSTKERPVSDLSEMFSVLLKAGFKISAMRAIYELRESDGFEIVPKLFNTNDKDVLEEVNILNDFATSVYNITKLDAIEANQDKLVQSYSTLIKYCQENHIDEITHELLFELVNLHKDFKNTVQQAFAIVDLCRIYQPSNRPPTPEEAKLIPFLKAPKNNDPTRKQVFKVNDKPCVNFREILIELYLIAIDLFKQGTCTYPPYALPIIQELKERCITDNVVKPLSRILEIESNIYTLSSNNDQVYFTFYRVLFTGNGFEENVRNKTMIYQENGFVKTDNFMRKLGLMFTGAQCFQSEEQYNQACETLDPQNGMVILVTNAEPTTEEEVNDPLFMKEIGKKPKFVHMYNCSNNVHVFKTQVSRNEKFKGMVNEFSGSRILQTYYYTDGHFPSSSRRINVIKEKTIERTLTPIQTACFMMTQQVEEMMVLNNTFQYYTNHKKSQVEEMMVTNKGLFQEYFEPKENGDNGLDGNETHKDEVDNGQIGGFRMKIKGTVEASVNGGLPRYIDAFINEDYLQKNPNDENDVEKLKGIFSALMTQVRIAFDTIEPYCTTENQKEQQKSNKKSFEELIEIMKKAGVAIDFDK